MTTTSWFPFQKSTDEKPGLTFVRDVQYFPEGATFVSNLVDSSTHCLERDRYGDNNCHYNWGESIIANITGTTIEEIMVGDHITGAITMDDIIILPYQFHCALCSEACTIHIPIINKNITIPPQRECPIPIGEINLSMFYQLDDHNPIPFESTKVHAEIVMNQGGTGKPLGQFSVTVFLK